MKKLIFTSVLATMGLFAQTSGNAPATQQKSNTATPAPAAQAPAKTSKHKHKKGSNTGTPAAVKPDTTGKDSSKAPTAPAAPVKK
jgi:hypothetical protein